MHLQNYKRRKQFKILNFALLTVALIFLTVFVWAKSPEIISEISNQEDNHVSPGQITEPYTKSAEKYKFETVGIASWYGPGFHRRKTANGERYNMYAMTAAHKKLPFGTILRVTNLESGETALVRINDRGPYVGKRILDLSYSAAKEIDGVGLPKVRIEALLSKKTGNTNIPAGGTMLFGYSYDKPLICVPSGSVITADSTNSFHTALELYDEIAGSNPDNEYYIFILADEKQFREKKNTPIRYYISRINEVGYLNQIAKN